MALAVPAFGASLADLAGTWNFYDIVTGRDAPWWSRSTMTIQPNGKFTLSGIASDGTNQNYTGTFEISSGGFLISDTNILCQMDLGKTVFTCTSTSPNGSTDIDIATKQAASYSSGDLEADDWEVNMLDGGPTSPSWMRVSGESIDDNGNSQGSYSDSNGNTSTISGQFAISANGEVTCISGNNCPDQNYNPDFVSYMDASKTIIVGTYGVSATNQDAVNPDAVLAVFTKMASSGSYSQDDLTGVWQGNLLAAGPDAPWWQRITLTIKRDGTSIVSSVQNNGKKKTYAGITWSISDNGVVTVPSALASNSEMVMNSGKTVMVETGSWGDGSTEFAIFTKSASLPGAPTI
jgi:hypothetical protein